MSLPLLRLREHQTTTLPSHELSAEHAELLWRRHGAVMTIEPPSFKNGQQWLITPGGCVGQIMVDDLRVWIEPKTPIASLFQMLAYAYRIEFTAQGELAVVDSLSEFCGRLAELLAARVLHRCRRGFHRDYQDRQSRLAYLRGAPVLVPRLTALSDALIDCRYQEHTGDIGDNQILLGTLQAILRSGLGDARTHKVVRRATQATRAIATPIPVSGEDCVGRLYTRLNDDYRTLHAICRFFLDGLGPSHRLEDRHTPPFLVDMPKLFEQFVAEWLLRHLPRDYELRSQHSVRLGTRGEVSFAMDLVIFGRSSQLPLAVIDTKYKTSASPSADDVQQVIAYAKTLGCREAILAYPSHVASGFDVMVGGDLRVSALAFSLADDIEAGGHSFLQSLLGRLTAPIVA